MGELVSARMFSHWQAQFFRAVYAFFLAIRVACFFFNCKGFAGIFFSDIPLLPQRSNDRHLRRTYKTFKKSRATPVLWQGSHNIIAMDA